VCVHLVERSLWQIKMYKRQFYGVDHADNNGDEASSTDSSSLDTDSDAASGDEEGDVAKSAYVSSSDADSGKGEPGDSDDDDDDDAYGAGEEDEEWSAFRESRGPAKVQPLDSSLFLLKQPVAAPVRGGEDEKKPVQGKVGDGMVLRVGGVLKCRLCVKTMCLNDETMKLHLLSKGHARSVKQLANGKLRLQLDSDGEEVEEAETHAERCERLRKLVEEKVEPVKRKRNSGRQRQRKRLKEKASRTKLTIPAGKETTPVNPTPTKTVKTPKTSKSPKGSKFVNGSTKKS